MRLTDSGCVQDPTAAPRSQREDGFALVEVVTAVMVFTVLALAFLMALLSAMGAYQVSRSRTLAEEVATEQMESARRLGYDDLGTVGGNPPGDLDAVEEVTAGTSRFTVRTRVSYVDDPLANGFQTGANYKRVAVSVAAAGTTKALASLETLVAPPVQPALNRSIIRVQVVDAGDNTPVHGALVDLRGGPDLRSDLTEPDGTVNFAALTPNPTSGPQAHYDLLVSHHDFLVLREDAPPSPATHVQVGPGQAFATAVRIYRPATIDITLTDSAGNPFAGHATVTVASSRGVQTVAWTGAPLHLTHVAGEAIVPGIEYTVSADAPGGWFAAAQTQVVPRNYPHDLGSRFTVPLAQHPTARVEVQVRAAAGNAPIPGARVDVSGGPGATFRTGVANSGGVVTFDVPAGAGYTVTVPAQAAFASAEASTSVPGPGVTVLRIRVPAAAT